MRRLAGIFFILLIGCTDNTKVPSGIIRQPQMQKILWEMVQTDRFATSFIQSRKDTLGRNKQETFELYDKVFSYNGITRDEFLKSYKFYLGRPDLMKVMFDSISAQAERRRSELYNHPKPSKPDAGHARLDSIRRADSVRTHNFSIIGKRDSVSKKKLNKPQPHRLP